MRPLRGQTGRKSRNIKRAVLPPRCLVLHESHLLRAQRLSDADQGDDVGSGGDGGIAVRQQLCCVLGRAETPEQAAEVEYVGGGVRSGEALDDRGPETGREVDDVVGGAAEEIVGC